MTPTVGCDVAEPPPAPSSRVNAEQPAKPQPAFMTRMDSHSGDTVATRRGGSMPGPIGRWQPPHPRAAKTGLGLCNGLLRLRSDSGPRKSRFSSQRTIDPPGGHHVLVGKSRFAHPPPGAPPDRRRNRVSPPTPPRPFINAGRGPGPAPFMGPFNTYLPAPPWHPGVRTLRCLQAAGATMPPPDAMTFANRFVGNGRHAISASRPFRSRKDQSRAPSSKKILALSIFFWLLILL